MIFNKITTSILFLLLVSMGFSQVGDNYFISSPSTLPVKKGLLDFRIYHLFGDAAGRNGGIKTLFGMDQARDVRFAFEYGLGNKTSLGISRSAGGYIRQQIFNIYGKHRFYNKNKMQIAFYTEANATAMEASELATSEVNFQDFSSRIGYLNGLIIQKDFEKTQVMASLYTDWRNFVGADEENLTLATVIGLKQKITYAFSFGADVLIPFNNDTKPGITLDFEFDTGGHVFQLYLSQFGGTTLSQNLSYGYEDLSKGEFRFGFMISRPFKI